MSRLQDADHKSVSELIADGSDQTQLLNDNKIYVGANSINKTLEQAIIDGDIGGGGSAADVSARYTSDSGQNVTNSVQIVVYEDQDYDTDSLYNSGTGIATIPVGLGGKYLASAAIEIIDNIATNQTATFFVYKNGLIVSRVALPGVSANNSYTLQITTEIDLADGDTLSIRAFNQAGTAGLATSGQRNYFILRKVS